MNKVKEIKNDNTLWAKPYWPGMKVHQVRYENGELNFHEKIVLPDIDIYIQTN